MEHVDVDFIVVHDFPVWFIHCCWSGGIVVVVEEMLLLLLSIHFLNNSSE